MIHEAIAEANAKVAAADAAHADEAFPRAPHEGDYPRGQRDALRWVEEQGLAPWLPVISYCAEEVSRQYSASVWAEQAAHAVGWMLRAWAHAMTDGPALTVALIQSIGMLVEPGLNKRGFRRIPIYVGGEEKAKADDIERLLGQLVDAYNEKRLDPLTWPGKTPEDEFYVRFEAIHPFRDGNGRTGKVLYNMLRGTLAAPVWPPDFYGGIKNP